jgi:hypothetical protein
MTDTTQQKAILRQCPNARYTRKRWPVGTRVTARMKDDKPGPVEGTVKRHVPGTNAQGGYLVVEWDNGNTGRHGPISLRKVEES